MPKLVTEIEEINTNINRPVVLQIANDVKKLTGFPDESDIYFNSFSKQVVNKESVMDINTRDGVKFSHNDRIIVTAEPKYSDPTIFSGQPFKINFRPIIYNEEYNILLSPVNYQIEFDMDLTFICKDRNTLENWRTNVRRKIGQSIKAYLHRIDYTYPINNDILMLLKNLYDVKGELIDNDTSFVEWVAENSFEKITGITNQIGNGTIVVVEQGQIGVEGIWKITELPDIEKMDTGDLYKVTLNYLVRFSQPTVLTLEYPIMLNNSFISETYIPPCNYNLPLTLGSPEKLIWGLESTRNDPPRFYPYEPVRVPCYDEWVPKKMPLNTAAIYHALIKVDVDNPRYVMTLDDIGENYRLADWLLELMELFDERMFVLGNSPVLVNLYRKNSWIKHDLLTLRNGFELYTKTKMKLYNLYHVRLALYTDLTTLSENAINTLIENGEITRCLLKTLGPEIIDRVPDLLSNGSLNPKDFWEYVSLLKKTHSSYKNGIQVRRITVGSCVIVVDRME